MKVVQIHQAASPTSELRALWELRRALAHHERDNPSLKDNPYWRGYVNEASATYQMLFEKDAG